MLSPGPGRLEPPQIEPFIRPRLQGGTHRAAAPSPNPLPLIGASAVQSAGRGHSPMLSFLASPAAHPVLSTHSIDSSEPLHSSLTKRPVEQPIRGGRRGLPHVQIPPSRPGPSLRESGVGDGRQRSVIGTVSGCSPWNPGRRLGLGGPLFFFFFLDRRTELTVDRNSVSCCSVSALDTRAHVSSEARSRSVAGSNNEAGRAPRGGSFRSRQAAQKIKRRGRNHVCTYVLK
jgi:hypothetical protein